MKTKSIWGKPPTRLYKLVSLVEKEFDKSAVVCIVGCSDGKFLLPFARKKIKVTGYDVDDIALDGGEKMFPIRENLKYMYSKNFISKQYPIETKKVVGIRERLELEGISDYATIVRLDFYRNPSKKKFDLVFTSCSLHYSMNKDFSLKDKTKKIQSIVKPGGYLYMDYMMAIDEDDYDLYPESKFYRKGEILDYFVKEEFEIISFKENNYPSFEAAHVDCVVDHFHRFGYILAKKKVIF